MRLAAFAIIVIVLAAYANHMLRLGVAARRDAAQYQPDATRPVQVVDLRFDSSGRLVAASHEPELVPPSMRTSTFTPDALFASWTYTDTPNPADDVDADSGNAGLADTRGDR